ncbi:adenosylcobinamide amidohydrolase [Streptomyces sp. SF28]|nr:adenosylcobinamide amidohydrolase [Streptomyces pinistramenti]MCB5911566.1 adenosylcobinamide amidohydrolase [Streptomyces pinistramenti]
MQHRDADGAGALPALLWRAGPGWRMISSAVLGGGIGTRSWVLNAQVGHGYTRRDPAAHLAEIAAGAGAGPGAVPGPAVRTAVAAGVGLMTAADVLGTRSHARDGGAEALVTAGVGVCGWAAVPPAATLPHPGPGTINTLVALPVPLTDAALVNAVATATEAKVQALFECGCDASGTPTDAVCVAARAPRPGERAEEFAGPRSLWGARLARAVRRATLRAVTLDAASRSPERERAPGGPPRAGRFPARRVSP